MQQLPLRAAAYCRVSTDKEDQRNSLAAQEAFFQQYLQDDPRCRLVGIYSDEGLSGTSRARPGFSAMLSAALAGEVDLILTKEVSRFARNTVDTLQITRALRARGIGVVFLTDGIDTRDSDGEFRLAIMASVAQEESRKISQRARWGQLQAMRRGVVFGSGTLYGYRLHRGVLSPDPQQAPVVRLIFEKYLDEGKGVHTIARELTQAGIPTPLSGTRPWSENTVRGILRNEKYCGDLVQKKSVTLDYLSHKRVKNDGLEEQITLPEHHPPLLSPQRFQAAQEEAARRATLCALGERHSGRYWYSGKVRCALCGAPCALRRSSRPGGRPYATFVCRTRRLQGTEGCPLASVNLQTMNACARFLLTLLPIRRARIARQLPPCPQQELEPLLFQSEAMLEAVVRSIRLAPDQITFQLWDVPGLWSLNYAVSGRGNSYQTHISRWSYLPAHNQ